MGFEEELRPRVRGTHPFHDCHRCRGNRHSRLVQRQSKGPCRSPRTVGDRLMGIRTAVFPVGGFGTRFLPATKAVPKEMLPVVDKPLIQYAVEEARDAGIENYVFVTAHGKVAVENHFDRNADLERALIDSGREDLLAAAQVGNCLLYTSPSPRDRTRSRMPS